MASTVKVAPAICLRNILFLTDFSEPSERSLPFVAALARWRDATVHALHVVVPDPLVVGAPETASIAFEAKCEQAFASMKDIKPHLAGVAHECLVEQAVNVWDAVEQAIRDYSVDLIVAGTHGRTGAQRFLLGSAAEEILRRSPVPVMTIGPAAQFKAGSEWRFPRVLYATDFSPTSLAAAPFAIFLASETESRLVLLHVLRMAAPRQSGDETRESVAETIHRLRSIVPEAKKPGTAPEALIEYGRPAERILEVAHYRNADAIVLGVRSARGHLASATHFERALAHEVVAQAPCPVITVCCENCGLAGRAPAD
ncbi:MAG TPA: universal stress protein [Candidatus Acidoferrales bacterium]|nr:universal stress protein [Candidatus Acidoferrales bacterium]